MDCNRRGRPTGWVLGLAFVAAWLGGLTQAWAFLCSRNVDLNNNRTGPSLAWFNPNIEYVFNSTGPTKLDSGSARATVRDSFSVWQDATLREGQSNCALLKPVSQPYSTVLSFSEGPDTDQNFTGYNYLNLSVNRNVILFRETVWPHPDDEDGVIALTTTTFNHVTGEIFDADIEFNLSNPAITFTIGDDTTSTTTDLMNTASHEIGHVIGLSHSDDGNATMFKVAQAGETSKRQLACDDLAGLLFRYATADIGYCDDTNSDNCGDCQPPTQMMFSPTIKITAVDEGFKQITCQNAPTPAWPALLLLLWAYGHAWRRRQQPAPRRDLC